MSTVEQHSLTTSIDPATQIGLLELTVADLDRSLRFYTDAMGFAILERGDGSAILGAGTRPLLLLTEQKGARPWPRDRASYTGLYHFAILVPTRTDLGRWLRHWLALGHPLPGQGDHLVSEALYLEDPDGNGIEVYRDRPRSEWTWHNGQVRMASEPVDIRGLLVEAEQSSEPWTGLPSGTTVGHIHLQVGNIAQAEAFYHEVLGFDVVASMPSALFVSAGGYHHHIGMNIWHSRGASAAPIDSAGLRFFTIDLPNDAALRAVMARVAEAGLAMTEIEHGVVVRDPWQNILLLHIGSASDAQAAADLARAISTVTVAHH